jgi:hypothetical protein
MRRISYYYDSDGCSTTHNNGNGNGNGNGRRLDRPVTNCYYLYLYACSENLISSSNSVNFHHYKLDGSFKLFQTYHYRPATNTYDKCLDI